MDEGTVAILITTKNHNYFFKNNNTCVLIGCFPVMTYTICVWLDSRHPYGHPCYGRFFEGKQRRYNSYFFLNFGMDSYIHLEQDEKCPLAKNELLGPYYSFKIFLRFWLAKIPRIIHYNHLLSTKFGRILRYVKKWSLSCSKLPDYWTVNREDLWTRLCSFGSE